MFTVDLVVVALTLWVTASAPLAVVTGRAIRLADERDRPDPLRPSTRSPFGAGPVEWTGERDGREQWAPR